MKILSFKTISYILIVSYLFSVSTTCLTYYLNWYRLLISAGVGFIIGHFGLAFVQKRNDKIREQLELAVFDNTRPSSIYR